MSVIYILRTLECYRQTCRLFFNFVIIQGRHYLQRSSFSSSAGTVRRLINAFGGLEELEFTFILFEKLSVPQNEQKRILSKFIYGIDDTYGVISKIAIHAKVQINIYLIHCSVKYQTI